MSFDASSVSPDRRVEPSGTREEPQNSNISPIVDSKKTTEHDGNEGAPLQWQEIIQLQEFSERKAWIEEKINFLESLPPIEVFVGLDAVKAGADTIPGLPTPDELRQWDEEHDKIEKDTEIFDSGELKKLREVTKAASKRNLSPEDTDLIELTLTTIYQLDKLLHLLRDRSENLDLLGIRLTWEEQRSAAWRDHRQIISDLREFLEARVQWSPSVYDQLNKLDEPLPQRPRRGSMVSIASVGSDTSLSTSLGFSRTARFKQAELLSRDAAQLAGRVSSLRHGKIAATGRTLDKLIDHSRKSVPEELLDEQDRLETKGINEMEDIGKFVMNVVMQWKKADEFYVETIKDQGAAQALVDEIETAHFSHPVARQAASYTSRVDALVKRLRSRTHPASSTHPFPRPTHPLFPGQEVFNDAVVETLSAEYDSALELTKRAEVMSNEYSAMLGAVKKAEALCNSARDTSAHLASIMDRLTGGVATPDGDGSPPDLTNEACLEAGRHGAFLAVLPSLLDELGQQSSGGNDTLRLLRAAMLKLNRDCVDPKFITLAESTIDHLAEHIDTAADTRSRINAQVTRLREVRRIWALMTEAVQKSQGIWQEVGEAVERGKWESQAGRDGGMPLTPESPGQYISPSNPEDVSQRLDDLQSTFDQKILPPLSSMAQSLEPYLHTWMTTGADNLRRLLQDLRDMHRLWEIVQKQADVMSTVRDEVHDLQIRIEELNMRYESTIQEVLVGECVELEKLERVLHDETQSLQTAVQRLTDSLPHRIPFVASDSVSIHTGTRASLHRSRFSASSDFKPDALQRGLSVESPIDLSVLDGVVRDDINTYSMRLSGEAQCLERKAHHLKLAAKAKDLDMALSNVIQELYAANLELANLRSSLSDPSSSLPVKDYLNSLSTDLDRLSESHLSRISPLLSSIRDHLRQMESMPDSHDVAVYETMVASRVRSADDIQSRFVSWTDDVAALKDLILEAHRTEAQLQEQKHIAEQKRLQEEKDRLHAEQIERERMESEEKARIEREQKELEEREMKERERLQAIERERMELEEKARIEHERKQREEQEAREQLRLAAEESARVERERSDKTRLEEEGTDVFGLRVEASSTHVAMSPNMVKLQAEVFALRKRLRSLSLDKVTRPFSSSTSSLPNDEERVKIAAAFSAIVEEASSMPSSVEDVAVNSELQYLKTEVDAAVRMMERIHQLADMSLAIQHCDDCLSDLLEHIDSYPAAPAGPLMSLHVDESSASPEEQLSARVSFTRTAMADMDRQFEVVNTDPRAVPERARLLQTWSELEEMSQDRIGRTKSRSASVVSSVRSSTASMKSTSKSTSTSSITHKKIGSYGRLSMGSPGGRFLAPPPPSRRSTSGTVEPPRRSSSRASLASTSRSVSGPNITNSKLHSSTFASRQRTLSGLSSSSNSSMVAPAKQIPATPSRPRAHTGQIKPRRSPTMSDASSHRSTASLSTWSRGSRPSFPSLGKGSSPRSRIPQFIKREYIPNPGNKLDVAVGDVVNSLPVNINIEVVADTWKDQSGKYWIGDHEPKLCFCRILRSQTVMVRVGGGWTELSKFIKGHFADLFRLLPDSPPRPSVPREEKWISSKTLLEATEESPPPRTPEPRDPFVPTFALSTPSGRSPQSLKSTPSQGSPLTPLQFMRRADLESLASTSASTRPSTPVKRPPSTRSRKSTIQNTPSRTPGPVWRP